MKRLTVIGVMAVAASCSVHEVKHNPAPPVQVPEGYRGEAAGRALPEQWWQDFRDPDLDMLVDAALADNLQLAGAFARIEQARAVANKAGAGRWPQINASLTARRSSSRVFFGPQEFEFTQNQFQASIGAAYEVDVWKRIGSQHASAKLEVLATRDDLEAVAISLTSEVAEAWFDLLAHRERRTLLEAQLSTNEIFLELVALRAREGLGAGAVDVFQASSQVDAVKAQLALIDALEKVAEFRIALLVGKAPGTVTSAPFGAVSSRPITASRRRSPTVCPGSVCPATSTSPVP
jgi:outer membrane protein TolC